jgi:hypothetical protein
VDGRLLAVEPSDPVARPKKPQKVGVRRRFFRDPEIARAAERILNSYEDRAIGVLRTLDQSWPPSQSDRLALAPLIAIHMLRNPYARQRMTGLQLQELQRRRANDRATMTEEQIRQFLHEVTDERFLVKHMLDSIPKATSLIASTHWTLLKFSAPLLATSDHPVTIVPLLADGASSPVRPLPPSGLLNTEEFRFAINPRVALLCTWLNEPDDGPPVAGTDELAAELNRAVISQADKEWFHHPDRHPAQLTPANLTLRECRAIGGTVLPQYGSEHALNSRRRQDTSRNLERMIEEEITDRFFVAGVGRIAA